MAVTGEGFTPVKGEIVVCGLSQARRHKRRFDAVITVEYPLARPGLRLRFNRKPAPAHLVLAFEDFDSDQHGVWVATAADVETALAFGRKHQGGALLIHCHHGVGRSAAIALMLLADRLGTGNEDEAVAALFRLRPEATPNLVIVALADAALQRNGALVAALANHEAKVSSFRGKRDARFRLFSEQPSLFARARPVSS